MLFTEEVIEQADHLSFSESGTAKDWPELEALERELASQPFDLLRRVKLLQKYYFFGDFVERIQSKSLSNARTQHILWMIENAHHGLLAGDSYMGLSIDFHPENYEKVKGAWIKQLQSGATIQSKINAALFCFNNEQETAHSLAQEALHQDPSNYWARMILDEIKEPRKPINEREFSKFCVPDLGEGLIVTPNPLTSIVDKKLENISSSGSNLLRMSVRPFEERLANNPADFEAMAVWLEYSFRSHIRVNELSLNPEIAQKRYETIVWIIKNIPDSLLAGCPTAYNMIDTTDANDYGNLRNLWYLAITKTPQSRQIRLNASRFLQFAFPEEADELLTNSSVGKE